VKNLSRNQIRLELLQLSNTRIEHVSVWLCYII